MELLCPNCQQKLNIPDQYAGQLMRCPLCNGTFQAPALPPANAPAMPAAPSPVPAAPPPSSPPPAPSSEPFVTAEPPRGAPPPPPPRHDDYVPVIPVSVMEEPRGPSRDYIRCCACTFKLPVVTWIAPGALLLVLLFSFLPWISLRFDFERAAAGPNAWSLGFGHGGDPLLGIFDILMILALVASVPSALMAIGIIPTPRGFRMWRAVILTSLIGLTFLFFTIRYVDGVFHSFPATLWIKLSWRLMFVATLTSAMEIWLELRRAKNLPPPKIEMYR
jgi:hypothetical protein